MTKQSAKEFYPEMVGKNIFIYGQIKDVLREGEDGDITFVCDFPCIDSQYEMNRGDINITSQTVAAKHRRPI